ncbi:Ulp1 protease family, carboxy-terminal domain protein [Sesbania bispinosa]|nr:Ulp1 protease family, carboxy-terminal domain protein [Sesbania bispinosa]
MAGEGISSRTRSQKGRKETKKPRQSRNMRSKKKRVQEIIEISSSFHESNPNTVGRDPPICATTQETNNDKDLRNEVSEVKTEIKELRVSMNKLTTYIENTSPITACQNESPIPISISTMQTPKNSSVSEKTDKAYGNKEFLIGKRLFQTLNDDATSIYYLNNKPLNTHRYDGRTVGVKIPFWYPVSYRVPADMVLDDLEASIAPIFFGLTMMIQLIMVLLGVMQKNLLNCLNPSARIISEVLNQLATRLTDIERFVDSYFTAWILPTTFSLNVLERGASATRIRTSLKNKFIFQADNLRKVTEDSRMRIVVDLVLHDYNNVKKLIVLKASDNWVRLNKNWRAA